MGSLNKNASIYKAFVKEFGEALEYLHKIKSDVIIAGDFNINLLKGKEKRILNEYLDTVIGLVIFSESHIANSTHKYIWYTYINNLLCKLSPRYAYGKAGIIISDI